MSKPTKLVRKNSAEVLIKKKPETNKSSPRNLLKELNSSSLPPPHSGKGPRGGCFGFLLSNSSSKASLPRSKSLTKTPKSAPPNPRTLPSFKNPSNPPEARSRIRPHRNPSRPSFENLKQIGAQKPQKPKTPNLLQLPNRRKPCSGGPFRKRDTQSRGQDASAGKLPELSFEVVLERDGSSARESKPESCLESTPERRTHSAFTPEVGLGLGLGSGTPVNKLSYAPGLDSTSGEEGGEQQQPTTTTTTTTTPPVQASISPEILGWSVLPTPACFAAGHVIAGVQDRRKCRPRGILNVGGSGPEIVDNLELGLLDGCGNDCRISLVPPPLTGASIHWLSSPSVDENGRSTDISSSRSGVCLRDCPAKVSVNWLLSPCKDAKEQDVLENFPVDRSTTGSDLSGRGVWTIYPTANATGASPNSSHLENTPLSGEGTWRTPTTNSSISPFSMIIRKAAASSRCKVISPSEDRGRNRYGSALGNSPFSGESWGNSNVMCTPSSYSSSNRQVGPSSRFEQGAMAEVIETLSSTSPQSQSLTSDPRILPSSALSFQFGCLSTPSKSIDLAQFQKPSCRRSFGEEEFCIGEENLSGSAMRISWREGLISRIFEMDELDCCHCLSDEEEDGDSREEDQLSSKFDLKFNQRLGSSVFTDVIEQVVTDGFGSFEFVPDKQGDQRSEAKIYPPRPISCAESISTEGGGLVSSDDSDWTLFYKNNLFEV